MIGIASDNILGRINLNRLWGFKVKLLKQEDNPKMRKRLKFKNIKNRAKKNRARYLSALEHSYPKHVPKYSLGNCGLAAELIAKDMISKRLTHYSVVEGMVIFSNGNFHRHTWMEYGDTKYDPCLEQFDLFGDDYDLSTVKYITGSKCSPVSYLKACEARPLPDEYIQKVLNNELKSSQYKRIAK